MANPETRVDGNTHDDLEFQRLVATYIDRLIAGERFDPIEIVANHPEHGERLLEELESVRKEGVAYDREEQSEGICAIGSVVNDPFDGQLAISVAVPATRFYGHEKTLIRALDETCTAVQKDLLSAGGSDDRPFGRVA